MDRVYLDPAEMIANRVEFEVTQWINADQGVDWGDAAMTKYEAAGRYGSLPVDYTIPNREVTIPLTVMDRGTTTFEQFRDKLQNKVGLYQAEGGVIRRIQSDGGTVYADVTGAEFTFPGSWEQSWRDVEPGAALRLSLLPDWYEAEQQMADHVETAQPELIFTETVQRGHMPGRLRIVVDEDQNQIQRGLIWGVRSKNYDAAASAALTFEAETRTLLGGAAVVTLTGASGGASNNAVQQSSLSTTWSPIISTTASSGSVFATHRGTYRVWARCYSSGGNAVALRFVWDVGDLLQPTENDKWTFPSANVFFMADLGTIYLRETTGTHRWEGQVQAKGLVGGESVHIDKLFFQPLDDGGGILRASSSGFGESSAPVARDDFNQTAGALAGKVAPVGGTWAEAGAAGAFNVSGSPNFNTTRTTTADASPHFGILGASNYGDTHLFVSITRSGDYTGSNPWYGLAARYIDINNYLRAIWIPNIAGVNGHFYVQKRVASVDTTLAFTSLTIPPALTAVVDLYVYATGYFDAFLYINGTERSNATLVASLSGYDADLVSGGALGSGKPGIMDQHPSATATTRTYDHFYVQSAPSDAVLFGQRSAQLTTDGMFRQDSTGVAYGPVSWVEGDLPRMPPSRPEGRTVQFFLKASRGDLNQLPDVGIDDISARCNVKASNLFTRG